MTKHQSLCCRLYVFIGEHQICALGLGPSLQILFSHHAVLDEFRLSQVLQDQSLEYEKNLLSVSVMVSAMHIAINHMELEEHLSEKDLLAYVELEQAQLFPRLGKDIYFDFVAELIEGKQLVNVFAIDKEQLCYWVFKEDAPVCLGYLGIDKVVENASRDLLGVSSSGVATDIFSEKFSENFSDIFLDKLSAKPKFYNFYQDFKRLPELFMPLLYLVVKEEWS